MDEKFILKSKTIIGVVITLLGALNVPTFVTNEEVGHILDLGFELFGAVLAIYGRITATKTLGWGGR